MSKLFPQKGKHTGIISIVHVYISERTHRAFGVAAFLNVQINIFVCLYLYVKTQLAFSGFLQTKHHAIDEKRIYLDQILPLLY